MQILFQNLNVAGNKIRELDSVFPVSKLPILESLNLQGNPVTTVVDYRLKVFESFGKRYFQILLKMVLINSHSHSTALI